MSSARALLTSQQPVPLQKRTFNGEPVSRFDMETPTDVPGLRDRLHDVGIDTYEADVRFAIRYLIERGIKGGLVRSKARATPGEGITWVVLQPRAAAGGCQDRTARAGVRHRNRRQGRAAARDLDVSRTRSTKSLIVDGSDRPMLEKATRCLDEYFGAQRVLRTGAASGSGCNHRLEHRRLRFDRRCRRWRSGCGICSCWAAIPARSAFARPKGISAAGRRAFQAGWPWTASISLRGAFIRMDDYPLDAVAREVLGEGKAVAGDARDRLAEILHNYRHDLPGVRAVRSYRRTVGSYEIVA